MAVEMVQCRKAVSQKKRRYKEDGFNLDLTALTDRIIIFGWPAIGLEHCYRNPRKDVINYFEKYHKDHYFIFNFCSESGRSYDPAIFGHRVSVIPFQDHCIPNPSMMAQFTAEAQEWLAKDEKNVVGVHCKAGKGRSGMFACCLFQLMKEVNSAKDAIAMYNERRTTNNKGLTVPSQRRWVGYYERMLPYLRAGTPFIEPELQLKTVRFTHKATSGTGQLIIYNGMNREEHNVVFRSEIVSADQVLFDVNVKVQGNVLMEYKKGGSKVKLDIWFNTGFVEASDVQTHLQVVNEEGTTLTIPKLGVDKLKKDTKHTKMPADFNVIFTFEPRAAAADARLTLVPHKHTMYCDRKHAVCRAEGKYREGETVVFTPVNKSAAISTVDWYRSDQKPLPQAAGAGAGAGVAAAGAAGAEETKTEAGAAADGATVTDAQGIVYKRVEPQVERIVYGTLPDYVATASDTSLSAANNGAAMYNEAVATAAADASKYFLSAADIGCKLIAVGRTAAGEALLSAPTPLVEAAPPKIREIWIEGTPAVGSTLRAGYWYFGGKQPGPCLISWVAVSEDGDNDETPKVPIPATQDAGVADPRNYLLKPSDANCAIKVRITPINQAGDKGYPSGSRPTSLVAPAAAAAVEAEAAAVATEAEAVATEADAVATEAAATAAATAAVVDAGEAADAADVAVEAAEAAVEEVAQVAAEAEAAVEAAE